MSLDRTVRHEPVVRRTPREDAVAVVRRALGRAERRHPLFPGEEAEAASALGELEGRLKRLKTMGAEFGEIELSVYARQLRAGGGRITMVS